MKAAISNLSKQNPLWLAAGAALLAYALYLLARKAISDTAGAAGALLTGDNAITKDTAYEGKGVAGTLGAAADAVSGGVLSKTGSWIAGLLSSDVPMDMLYYAVTFPDGARHAVPSMSIAKDGVFTYEGRRYVMGMQGDKRVARAAG